VAASAATGVGPIVSCTVSLRPIQARRLVSEVFTVTARAVKRAHQLWVTGHREVATGGHEGRSLKKSSCRIVYGL